MKRTTLIIIATLLILGGAYYFMEDRTEALDMSLLQPAPPDQNAPRAEWSGLLPEVRRALLRESPELQVDRGSGVAIHEEADLTGDGITEVLVNAGVGGAYTSSLVLMEVKNGGPAVAQLRTKDGDIIHADSFLEGSSVRNGEETNLMAERGGVYAAHYSADAGGGLEYCAAEAYVWNSASGLFEYNAGLSVTIADNFCADIRSRFSQPLEL